ncbi:MAG: hypothetical protein JWR61_2239 [Ferruginibacter sp.]|nr:hypothetical protein [Ferruginibacter sp.]
MTKAQAKAMFHTSGTCLNNLLIKIAVACFFRCRNYLSIKVLILPFATVTGFHRLLDKKGAGMLFLGPCIF